MADSLGIKEQLDNLTGTQKNQSTTQNTAIREKTAEYIVESLMSDVYRTIRNIINENIKETPEIQKIITNNKERIVHHEHKHLDSEIQKKRKKIIEQKNSKNESRLNNSPLYHEGSVAWHTSKILNNMMRQQEKLYGTIKNDLLMCLTTKDFFAATLHDIGKIIPYYILKENVLCIKHTGHEILGAFLLNHKYYAQQAQSIYKGIYSPKDWEILTKIAIKVQQKLHQIGLTKENIQEISHIVAVHYKLSKVRDAMYFNDIIDLESLCKNKAKVDNQIKSHIELYKKDYNPNKGISLQKELQEIGSTYLWDNISKNQFLPNMEEIFDSKKIIQKKHIAIQKAMKILTEKKEGRQENMGEAIITEPYGHFFLHGIKKYGEETNEQAHQLINKIIQKNHAKNNGVLGQEKSFILQNKHGLFLHEKHFNHYLASIERMYMTIAMVKEYFLQISEEKNRTYQ